MLPRLFCLLLRLFLIQFHLRNQLLVSERPRYGVVDHTVHHLPVAEAKLHLGGMDIDIQKLRLNGEMQHGKRILVLHHKRLVGLFYGLRYDAASDIPPIDEIIFVVSVAPGDHRLPDKAADGDILLLRLDCQQIRRNLPAEDRIDDVL